MRRSVFLTIMALGTVITILGATGIVAVFNDTADTPTNSFASGSRPSTADIEVAETSDLQANPTCSDGTFADNFVSYFFNVTDAQPSAAPQNSRILCVRNAGAGTVNLTTRTFDMLDVDTDCTGDENSVDATCGGGGTGEIREYVVLHFKELDCSNGTQVAIPGSGSVGALVSFPLTLSPGIGPGQAQCFKVEVIYNPNTADANVAQSDQVTWKQRFTAQAP